MGELYIHHVTLTTGHVRRSVREEVAPETWRPVSDLLAAALRADTPIPGVSPACTFRASASTRCLVATVSVRNSRPLVIIGVAAHSRCGASLWRRLHQGGGLATRAEDVPPEPWCAARLEAGIALHPEHAHWLGDFERCLAWVWIERDRVRRG